MKNLLRHHLIKRCEILIDETDMVKVLRILDQLKLTNFMTMGDCGWLDHSKWFIRFNATEVKWNSVITILRSKGIKNVLVPTKDMFGKMYFEGL